MYKSYEEITRLHNITGACPVCKAPRYGEDGMLCPTHKAGWEKAVNSDTWRVSNQILSYVDYVNSQLPTHPCAECEKKAIEDDYLCKSCRQLANKAIGT